MTNRMRYYVALLGICESKIGGMEHIQEICRVQRIPSAGNVPIVPYMYTYSCSYSYSYSYSYAYSFYNCSSYSCNAVFQMSALSTSLQRKPLETKYDEVALRSCSETSTSLYACIHVCGTLAPSLHLSIAELSAGGGAAKATAGVPEICSRPL